MQKPISFSEFSKYMESTSKKEFEKWLGNVAKSKMTHSAWMELFYQWQTAKYDKGG
mgnify:FL=1